STQQSPEVKPPRETPCAGHCSALQRAANWEERDEMSQAQQGFGFAPDHDAPIPYMQRIRDYYLALGYATPYRWAHYAEVPFRRERPERNPNDPRRYVRCRTGSG